MGAYLSGACFSGRGGGGIHWRSGGGRGGGTHWQSSTSYGGGTHWRSSTWAVPWYVNVGCIYLYKKSNSCILPEMKKLIYVYLTILALLVICDVENLAHT